MKLEIQPKPDFAAIYNAAFQNGLTTAYEQHFKPTSSTPKIPVCFGEMTRGKGEAPAWFNIPLVGEQVREALLQDWKDSGLISLQENERLGESILRLTELVENADELYDVYTDTVWYKHVEGLAELHLADWGGLVALVQNQGFKRGYQFGMCAACPLFERCKVLSGIGIATED